MVKIKRILGYLLIGSILLDNIFIPVDVGFDFRFQYVIYLLFIPISLLFYKVKLNTSVLLVLVLIILFFIASVVIKGTSLSGPTRQLLLITVCAFPFYQLLSAYQFDVRPVFKIYLDASFFISFIAIIQFVSFIVGFKYGYDFSYLGFDMSRLDPNSFRVQAWLMEPSFLSYFLMPAVFASILSLFKLGSHTMKGNVIVVIAFLLTQSLISYIALVLLLLLIFFSKYSFLKNPIIILGSLLFIVIISITFYLIPQIKNRIDDTLLVFNDGIPRQQIHLSTYHFYSNLIVSLKSLENKPFTGFGLGNYFVAYNEYVPRISYLEAEDEVTPDGASLLFRLLVETGLLFTCVVMWFLYKFRVKATVGSYLWIVNNSILVMLIMRLVRMPHYTILGLPFFVFLFYASFKQHRQVSRISE